MSKIYYICSILSYIKFDIISFRFLNASILGFMSCLPDLYIIAHLRLYILKLLGADIKISSKSYIRSGFFSEYPKNIKLGKNVQVSKDVYFCSNAKIIIGDGCRIAMGVKVINISHHNKDLSSSTKKEVIIGNNCHISSNAVILPGSIIEDYVFIGAGAVISGKTKKNGLYLGNPARFIGLRNDVT